MGGLDLLLGAFMIGTILNVALWGINLMQMSTYISSRFNDRQILVWVVWTVFIVGNVHTIVSCLTIYSETVTHFGDLVRVTTIVPWSFCIDPFLTAIIAFEVQGFYAYRIYVLSSRKNILLPIVVCVLTLTQFVFGFICTGLALKDPTFVAVAKIDWAVGSWLFLMVVADLILTGAIVYFLNSAKQDQEATNSVLDRIIESTIRNNALTAVTSIVSAALFVWGVGAWHVIAGLIISKLYQVSFMASLNARKMLAQELRAHRGTGISPSPNPGAGGGAIRVNVNSASGSAGRRPSYIRGKSHDHLHLPSLSAFSMGSHGSHSLGRTRSREPGLDSMPIHVTVEQTSSDFVVEEVDSWANHDKHYRSAPLSQLNHADAALPSSVPAGPFQHSFEEVEEDEELKEEKV